MPHSYTTPTDHVRVSSSRIRVYNDTPTPKSLTTYLDPIPYLKNLDNQLFKSGEVRYLR